MERLSSEDVRKRPEWEPYARTFSRMMRELGGWSQEQSDTYLEDRLQNDGFRSWFPHDNPSKEAAPLLMPDDLRDNLEGLPWVKLRERICEAIDRTWPEHCTSPETDPQYDWEAARRRVAHVIEEYRTNND